MSSIRDVTRTVLLSLVCLSAADGAAAGQAPTFEVSFPEEVRSEPLTGRLVVIVAEGSEPEPRYRLAPRGPAVFGRDLEALRAGETARVDGESIGHPVSLAELEPGEYCVQAVANVYERVERADGHVLWLPFNDGRRAFFTLRAGNLHSDVRCVEVGDDTSVRLRLTNVVPASEPPAESKWLKHVRVRSEKLTRFWGRPVHVHAKVLLPRGYEERPDVRYPVVYTLGHDVPFGFTTDSTGVEDPGEVDPRTGLETGYDFYRSWISDDFPRFIAVAFHQQTPYFLDSYSINSANNGPYGDAVVEEVIPALEDSFRIIRRSYAHIVEGASTGGWQALALQLHYPEAFGGAWVLQPDPIDFRSYQLVNIYEEDNAFAVPGGRASGYERPFRRTVRGQPLYSVRDLSRFEAVLGSEGRAGFQLSAWEAIFGPVARDGYPKPLWDKLTGEIDHEVADYMRENGYDLRAYAARHWDELGDELVGKLHFFAGDMDDFYLNLAVYRFEDFLASTTDPHVEGEFTYGRPLKGHGWHAWTWAEMLRRVAEHVRESAPGGADGAEWSY